MKKIGDLPLVLLVLFSIGITHSLAARSTPNTARLMTQAQQNATPKAKKVLRVAQKMVARGVIVRGSCWDYLNAVFTQAGYPAAQRHIVYRTSKRGPYARVGQIRPGDWLYYVNHSYGGVEHSGLFIGWTNRARKQALILSYPGERRHKPGRYRVYDLRSVYQITRAQ